MHGQRANRGRRIRDVNNQRIEPELNAERENGCRSRTLEHTFPSVMSSISSHSPPYLNERIFLGKVFHTHTDTHFQQKPKAQGDTLLCGISSSQSSVCVCVSLPGHQNREQSRRGSSFQIRCPHLSVAVNDLRRRKLEALGARENSLPVSECV